MAEFAFFWKSVIEHYGLFNGWHLRIREISSPFFCLEQGGRDTRPQQEKRLQKEVGITTVGSGCLGKAVRQDGTCTCREERRAEVLPLSPRQKHTCGASNQSDSTDRAPEADRKWAVPVWDFSCGEVPGNSRNKHSQGGKWLKWSPSESHWSQRGQEDDWLECSDQPVSWASQFFIRRTTRLTVEKVDANVFTHLLLLNFQHGQKVLLVYPVIQAGTLSWVLKSSLSFTSPSNQGAPSLGGRTEHWPRPYSMEQADLVESRPSLF